MRLNNQKSSHYYDQNCIRPSLTHCAGCLSVFVDNKLDKLCESRICVVHQDTKRRFMGGIVTSSVAVWS